MIFVFHSLDTGSSPDVSHAHRTIACGAEGFNINDMYIHTYIDNMCIYIYIGVCIYIYIYIIYIYIHLSLSLYTYIYIYTHDTSLSLTYIYIYTHNIL